MDTIVVHCQSDADGSTWSWIELLLPAVITVSVFVIGRWLSQDKDSREVHRTVTTGAGADARATLSRVEFMWWSNGVGAKSLRGAEVTEELAPMSGNAIDSGVLKQFYVVDASLAQLVVALGQYPKRLGSYPKWVPTWFGRSRRYRRLLAWHTSIHIAWVLWFIGINYDRTNDTEKEVVVADQLHGAWGRALDALDLVGRHRTERRGERDETVQGVVQAELERWLRGARAPEEEAKAVRDLVNASTQFKLRWPPTPNNQG